MLPQKQIQDSHREKSTLDCISDRILSRRIRMVDIGHHPGPSKGLRVYGSIQGPPDGHDGQVGTGHGSHIVPEGPDQL